MSIRLSKKYGVNPSVELCFFCQEPKGLILFGAGIHDKESGREAEAPREATYNREPCDKCADLMKQGVMLLSVRDGGGGDTPHRTGNIAVVRDEAIPRFVSPPELAEQILKARFCFLEDLVWAKLGLPTGDTQPKQGETPPKGESNDEV